MNNKKSVPDRIKLGSPDLPEEYRITPKTMTVVQGIQIPRNLRSMAWQNGVQRNILLKSWGGLGDQICTEPTIRFALHQFKKANCDVSLACERPELFRHLEFKRVFNLNEERPVYEKYNVFDTNVPMDESNLFWLFVSHCITQCVDYSSICALRMQLPVKDREVVLRPGVPPQSSPAWEPFNYGKPFVPVHAGKHWPSKTFPKDWWDAVLAALQSHDVMPVLIGANTDDNRSTVDVCTDNCIDLRNKLAVMETVWLLQNSRVLLTNDSAPLHMAVSGEAWVGYVATCKPADYITHWRKGEWGWRMKNFGKGDISELVSFMPNQEDTVTVEFVDEKTLRTWLPDPHEFAAWAAEKATLKLA